LDDKERYGLKKSGRHEFELDEIDVDDEHQVS
jgi:hypothetical protein